MSLSASPRVSFSSMRFVRSQSWFDTVLLSIASFYSRESRQ